MQTLINYIKDTDELTPFEREHNPDRAYAHYRRLQLETALAGNILESAQYAELARSVDATLKANHRLQLNPN